VYFSPLPGGCFPRAIADSILPSLPLQKAKAFRCSLLLRLPKQKNKKKKNTNNQKPKKKTTVGGGGGGVFRLGGGGGRVGGGGFCAIVGGGGFGGGWTFGGGGGFFLGGGFFGGWWGGGGVGGGVLFGGGVFFCWGAGGGVGVLWCGCVPPWIRNNLRDRESAFLRQARGPLLARRTLDSPLGHLDEVEASRMKALFSLAAPSLPGFSGPQEVLRYLLPLAVHISLALKSGATEPVTPF